MNKACVRCAMGASVLSTLLLIGSPALAMADTGSGGSATGTSGQSQSSDSAGTGGQDSGKSAAGASTRPRVDLRSSFRDSVMGVRTVRGPVTAGRPQQGIGGGSSEPSITDPAAPDPDGVGAEPGTSPGTTEPNLTVPAVTTPAPNSSNSQPTRPAPLNSPPAKPAATKAPLSYDKLPVVAHTVGNTVATLLTSTQETVAAVPALLAGLPTSTTPVTDVITTLEFMLTSVGTSVGTIVALPGELGALMGVTTQQPLPGIGVVGPETGATAAAGPVDLPALLLPQSPAVTLGTGAILTAPAAPLLPTATPVHVERITPITDAPLGVSGLTASGAPESFLDRAVSTLLVPISIATLAAVALPGVGGLLVICALGVRIGYRQAKAGWAVHVAGIGRFAGSGPLGVVRSGSLITLHVPRGTRTQQVGRLRVVDNAFERAA